MLKNEETQKLILWLFVIVALFTILFSLLAVRERPRWVSLSQQINHMKIQSGVQPPFNEDDKV